MDDKNKKFYIIIAVLAGIIMFLLGLIAGMFINLNLSNSKNGGTQVNTVDIGNSNDLGNQTNVVGSPEITPLGNEGAGNASNIADIGANSVDGGVGEKIEITDNFEKKDGETPLIYSGYQFMIPDDYGVLFESYGPVVHMNGIFQLRLVVKEESASDFNAHSNNPSELTQKAVDAGWKITTECKKYTIDGKDYFIFGGEADGENYLVFRTQIDDENIFAGNMAVFDDGLKDEDYYNIFANLAKQITKSSKSDTTSDEFYDVKYTVNVGDTVSEKQIKSNYVDITYKVPEAFYLTDSADCDENDLVYYNDSYMTNEYDMVDVRVSKIDGGAKYYIESDGRYADCEHKSFEKDGHTFYYAIREGKPDDFYIQSILVAADLKADGWLYIVDIYNDAKKYSLDDLAEFFTFTEK